MALSNPNKIVLPNENGCLMDTDLPNIDKDNTGPNATMSKTYLNKMFNNASFTGTGFTQCTGTFICFPCQTVADPSAKLHVQIQFYYTGTFSGAIGGFGQTEHTVVLKDLCGDGQFVNVHSVNIQCGTDDQGYAIYASPIEAIKSNNIKFRTVNTDNTSTGNTRTFKVYISGYATVDNTNFGLGQLFPIKS